MDNVCLSDPCSKCGGMLGGGYKYCPNCKVNYCFSCAMIQIMECHDVQLLKSGALPKCPKCGSKLV